MKRVIIFLVVLSLIASLSPVTIWSKGEPSPEKNQEVQDEQTQTQDKMKDDQEKRDEHKKEGEAQTEDEQEIKPTPRFIKPHSGQVIKGEFQIKIKVKNAQSCEFYLRRTGSLSPIYLGRGEQRDNQWKLDWDSNQTPNGKYKLLVKVKNQYGIYESEPMDVTINNPVQAKPDTEEVEQEIKEAKQEAESQQKEIEEIKKKTEQELAQRTQNLVEQATQQVAQPEQEEVEQETKQKVTQTAKQVEQALDQLSKKEGEQTEAEAKIEQKEKQSQEIEEKIKQTGKELAEIEKKKVQPQFEKHLEAAKEDKQRKLKKYKQEQEKIKQRKKELSQKLEEIKEDREEIKEKVKQSLDEVAQPALEEAEPAARQRIKEKIQRAQDQIAQSIKDLEQEVSEKEKVRQENFERLLKDSDQDGMTDYEEIEVGTDPLNSDSDGDGYLDEIEVKTGFDPLDPSPADKVVYEEPVKTKAPISDDYQVERVELVTTLIKKKRLKIEGKGLPNSFVTIYIYSEPLVLITKTDEQGNFVYTLDKPVSDGAHQVYVAITNNEGRIVERSEVFNFLKTPTAVAAILPPAVSEEVISPASTLQKTYTLLVVSIIILGLVVALVIIDLLIRRKKIK